MRSLLSIVVALALIAVACSNDTDSAPDSVSNSGDGDGRFEPALEEPPDRSGISYLDNLEARIEDGEWTLGEGLVKTLDFALFDEEVDALRNGEVITYELTGIIDMALDYVEEGPDQEAAAELSRMLDLVLFSEEQLQAMAGIGPPTASLVPFGDVVAQATEDCTRFFTGWDTPAIPSQCLDVELPSELDQLYPGQYKVYKPGPDMPDGGWEEKHYRLARDAMVDAVKVLKAEGTVPPISIVFSPWSQGSAGGRTATRYSVYGEFTDRPCGVVLYTSMKGLKTDGDFKQVVAHEIGHCFLGDTVPQQSKLPHGQTKWWSEGVPEYLSNVVYPDNNFEVEEYMDKFIDNELNRSLFDLSYDAFLWWQHVGNRRGVLGIVNLIRSLPENPERAAVVTAMNNDRGMPALFHEFGARITDWDRDGQSILDSDKNSYVPKPRAEVRYVTSEAVPEIDEELVPFRTARFELRVDEDRAATLSSRPEGVVFESARSAEGQWGPIPDGLPNEECDRTLFTVHTTTIDKGKALVDVPQFLEVEPGGLPGEWVANNVSVARRARRLLWATTPNPTSQRASASGTLRATFTSSSVHVEYETYNVNASITADEARAGTFRNYVGDEVVDTNASGTTGYTYLGEDLWFDAFTSDQFLRGSESVSLIETGEIPFAGEKGIPHELDEKFDRNPPHGWGVFTGIQEYEVQCDGTVLTMTDGFGTTTLYRVSGGNGGGGGGPRHNQRNHG